MKSYLSVLAISALLLSGCSSSSSNESGGIYKTAVEEVWGKLTLSLQVESCSSRSLGVEYILFALINDLKVQNVLEDRAKYTTAAETLMEGKC